MFCGGSVCIDNLSDARTAAAVPEAGTLSTMVLGLAGMARAA